MGTVSIGLGSPVMFGTKDMEWGVVYSNPADQPIEDEYPIIIETTCELTTNLVPAMECTLTIGDVKIKDRICRIEGNAYYCEHFHIVQEPTGLKVFIPDETMRRFNLARK